MTEQWDLVLINTPAGDQPCTIRLGLLTLASYVRKHGFSVTVFDGTLKCIKRRLAATDCARSVVGVTATTDVMPFASELCEFIKILYPTAVCVLGGNHVTALPEKTLRESRFDLAVLGEGELTLLELLSAWRQGTNLNVIRGTAFLQDGAFFRNEPRDLIHNLDVLPFPAYDLINVEHHFGGIRDRTARAARCLYVLASRGCPFDCAFCSSKIMWRGRLRWHSIDWIIQFIEKAVKDLRIDGLNFMDDELLCDQKRVSELAKRLIETGLSRRLKWECQSTVKSFTVDVGRMIKEAGCCLVRFGFESGCQNTLDFLKTNRFKVDDAYRAAEECKKAGLRFFGSFIIGCPDETLDDILETITFIQECGLSSAAIFVATPYPGTYLYQVAVEKGFLSSELSWSDYRVEGLRGKPLLGNRYFTADQLGRIRDYIDVNVVKPINYGHRPRNLNHRREIERILAGDAGMICEPIGSRIRYRIQDGFERPERIAPYLSRVLRSRLGQLS